MTNSTDFIASVYDTLVQTVRAEHLSEDFVMQMAWPGYSLTPADFKAHDAPDGPYDGGVATETLSELANIVPTFNRAAFENSGFELDDLYDILISGAIPFTASGADPLANPLQRLFSDARFELAQARRGFKDDPGRFYLPCTALPSNWYDEAAAATWSRIEVKSTDVKPVTPMSPFVKVDGLKLLDKGVLKLKPDATTQATLKADIVRTFDSRIVPRRLVPLRLAPASEAATAASGSTTLATADPRGTVVVKRTVPTNVFLQPGLKTDLNSVRLNDRADVVNLPARTRIDRRLLLQELVDRNLPIKPITPATSGFSMSMTYCRVQVNRPWLKLALLSMPNWFMTDVKAGDYSSGRSDVNTGMFPLLPMSFIAIRDLKITANWSPEDRGNMEKSVSLGFFNLRNGAFRQNTFEVGGLQIVAWISRFMPMLPPRTAASAVI